MVHITALPVERIKEVGTSGLKYCQLSKTFLIFNINAHSVHSFQF